MPPLPLPLLLLPVVLSQNLSQLLVTYRLRNPKAARMDGVTLMVVAMAAMMTIMMTMMMRQRNWHDNERDSGMLQAGRVLVVSIRIRDLSYRVGAVSVPKQKKRIMNL